MDKCTVRKEPKGVVLIIGAWNYPVSLCLLVLFIFIYLQKLDPLAAFAACWRYCSRQLCCDQGKNDSHTQTYVYLHNRQENHANHHHMFTFIAI